MNDLSDLIADCKIELKRLGLTWKSDRVLDYCEKVTSKRDAHYLTAQHLEALLAKLQQEQLRIASGVKVKVSGYLGVVQEWDEDIQSWMVLVEGEVELFDEDELEIAA